jgi:hypothetical protein
MSCALLHRLTTISQQIYALSSPPRSPLLRSAPSMLTDSQVNEEETMAVASMSAPACRDADASSSARSLAGTSLLLDESPPPPPPPLSST